MTDKINELMRLADEWADECGGCDCEHLAAESPRRAALKKALEAALKPHGEPVAYQYQDSEGRWYPFVNDEHYQNTVGDGRWPIRPLYTSPPAQTPPNKAELLCVCGAEWEWENRSWELVSTPTQTPVEKS